MRRSRGLALLVLAVGVAALLYGLAEGAGAAIPYPDPTPALLAHQGHDLRWARMLIGAGVALCLTGGAWLAGQLRLKR